MSRTELREFPGKGNHRCPAEERAFLDSSEGDNDEGVRSGDIRPCGIGVLQRCVHETREVLENLGVNPDLGMGDLELKLAALDASKREEILADIRSCYAARSGPGHGEFRSGHHQSPRSQRYHHRRVHARGHTQFRKDVGSRRKSSGYEGRHPRPELLGGLSGSH